jgi:hypothetical protein
MFLNSLFSKPELYDMIIRCLNAIEQLFFLNLPTSILSRQQEEESNIEELQSSMAAQNEAINALEQVSNPPSFQVSFCC